MSVLQKLTGLLIMLPALANAEFDETQLQSLFMTVEQRQEVDNVRNGIEKEAPVKSEVSDKRSEKINVSGFVKRSDGKNVVWVNGANTLQSDFSSGVQVQTNSINTSGQVTVIVDGERLKLKPGESWTRQEAP